MKIIIISGTGPPEPLTASRVHWDMALHLAKEKNKVWFISPRPSRPLGVKYPEVSGNRINIINGNLSHVQINSFTYPEYNILLRSYESADFGIKSIRFINRNIKNYDLIYASPWAFLGPLFILLLRNNKKVPFIINVQDLYPESFICKFRSGICRKALTPLVGIDHFIIKKSAHISVISESLKKTYVEQRKAPESKVSILHNWQNEDEFMNPVEPKSGILQKYGLSELRNKFIFMYLGNIGPVCGVENVIIAFARMQNSEKPALIIAGSGSFRDKCKKIAEKLQIKNISFPIVPGGQKSVVELQSIANILLLPIHPDASDSSIPSKLISYMLSAKPVITSANSGSETARVVCESDCGWIMKSNEAEEWTNIMHRAYETGAKERLKMGKAGFNYAIKNFSRTEGLRKANELFNKIHLKHAR